MRCRQASQTLDPFLRSRGPEPLRRAAPLGSMRSSPWATSSCSSSGVRSPTKPVWATMVCAPSALPSFHRVLERGQGGLSLFVILDGEHREIGEHVPRRPCPFRRLARRTPSNGAPSKENPERREAQRRRGPVRQAHQARRSHRRPRVACGEMPKRITLRVWQCSSPWRRCT